METKVYIDLESILDLRFSKLGLFDDSVIPAIMPQYAKRKSDLFWLKCPEIDKIAYQNFKPSDMELVKNAPMTSVIAFAKEIMAKGNEATPMGDIKVTINFGGMDLPEGLKTVFKNTLEEVFGLEVNCISVSNLMMGHSIIRESSLAFIYDFDTWLSANYKELIQTPIKDCTIYAPERAVKEDNDNETVLDKGKSLEFILGPFVSLVLLPLSLYCPVMSR